MGADLLIESIGFKARNDRCLIDEEWAVAAFDQARKAIAAIDVAPLDELERGYQYADVDEYKAELMKDLAEIEQATGGSCRQAAMIDGGGGVILLVAGGMSWGESPSELFESMSRVVEAKVFPDARWPPDPCHDPTTNQ